MKDISKRALPKQREQRNDGVQGKAAPVAILAEVPSRSIPGVGLVRASSLSDPDLQRLGRTKAFSADQNEGVNNAISARAVAIGRLRALRAALEVAKSAELDWEIWLAQNKARLHDSRAKVISSLMSRQRPLERNWTSVAALFRSTDNLAEARLRVVGCSSTWLLRELSDRLANGKFKTGDAVSLADRLFAEAVVPITGLQLGVSASRVVLAEPIESPDDLKNIADHSERHRVVTLASLDFASVTEVRAAFKGGAWEALSKSSKTQWRYVSLYANPAILRQGSDFYDAAPLYLPAAVLYADRQTDADRDPNDGYTAKSPTTHEWPLLKENGPLTEWRSRGRLKTFAFELDRSDFPEELTGQGSRKTPRVNFVMKRRDTVPVYHFSGVFNLYEARESSPTEATDRYFESQEVVRVENLIFKSVAQIVRDQFQNKPFSNANTIRDAKKTVDTLVKILVKRGIINGCDFEVLESTSNDRLNTRLSIKYKPVIRGIDVDVRASLPQEYENKDGKLNLVTD